MSCRGSRGRRPTLSVTIFDRGRNARPAPKILIGPVVWVRSKFLVYGELNPHGGGSARGAPAYLTWQSLLVQAFPHCCTEAEMSPRQYLPRVVGGDMAASCAAVRGGSRVPYVVESASPGNSPALQRSNT